MVTLHGVDMRVEVVRGWSPASPVYQITRAEGCVVHEIDGDQYVLITPDPWLGAGIVSYRGESPAGPWVGPEMWNWAMDAMGFGVSIADRPAVFIFYLLPTVPFMCLALAFVGSSIGRSWEAKAAIGIFLLLLLTAIVFVLGMVQKAPCSLADGKDQPWVYSHMCYTDLRPADLERSIRYAMERKRAQLARPP